MIFTAVCSMKETDGWSQQKQVHTYFITLENKQELADSENLEIIYCDNCCDQQNINSQ